MREAYITTTDNPFDPKMQFDDWYLFDEQKGYHSCSYLARIARTSDGLGDSIVAETIESAIDEILKFNLIGKYKKIVYEDDKKIEEVVPNV